MEPSSTSTCRLKSRACKAIPVLLIDADECFRSGLADNLRDDGHTVREYETPKDVPLLAATGHIAVAIVDYSLPVPDRLALADALHLAQPDVPVILVTAYCSEDHDAEIASRPFLHTQPRPLDYEVLHGLIHRLCTGRPT